MVSWSPHALYFFPILPKNNNNNNISRQGKKEAPQSCFFFLSSCVLCAKNLGVFNFMKFWENRQKIDHIQ
jgi:hypothetical protein